MLKSQGRRAVEDVVEQGRVTSQDVVLQVAVDKPEEGRDLTRSEFNLHSPAAALVAFTGEERPSMGLGCCRPQSPDPSSKWPMWNCNRVCDAGSYLELSV